MTINNGRRNCPVCGQDSHRIFLDENIAADKIDSRTFSSRKKPEYMRHKLVECENCSCVYAPSPPSRASLTAEYSDAPFESGVESRYAAQTYIKALTPFLREIPVSFVMDVGASDGAFLMTCREAGVKRVLGIEPSRDSVEKADSAIRSCLIPGMFSDASFPDDASPGLIASFMTLEHMDDPAGFVSSAHAHLPEGGMLAVVAHNYRGIVNRILGKHSPIIDIEHLQIFCPKALKILLANVGFKDIRITNLANRYPLGYWLKISPLSFLVKSGAYKGIFSKTLALPVGNFLITGKK